MIKKPSCFIRAVRDEKELEFIKENSNYILNLLHKYNNNNHIIYIVPEELKEQASFLNPFYIMKYDGNSREALMNTFEQCDDEIKNYCLNHINKDTYNTNLLFEKKKQEKLLHIKNIRISLTNQLLKINNNLTVPEWIHTSSNTVMIYGAGNIGKRLYDELKTKINILCFIDQYNTEGIYKNTPILKLENIKLLDIVSSGFLIIVTPIWDIENIEKDIKKVLNGVKYKIISIQEILNFDSTT